MTSLAKEYIIDKNYIYKNLFEEIKDLLEENEKIKIVTFPKYVPVAFQVAKELNEEGIALYDEELKIERITKEGKMKTKIYLAIKKKPEYNHYVIGKDHFYKNIFEDLKFYLKNHDKVTIAAKNGEVGLAFRVAKELVSQGIAIYDEELKLGRNFKEGQGNTQVFISLKKKPIIKEYIIKKNAESSEVFNDMKELFTKNEKITMTALPGDVPTAFKAAKKLIDERIAMYDEELKIKPNFKEGKGKTRAFISLKKRPVPIKLNNINTIVVKKDADHDEIIKKATDLLEKDEKINLVTKTSEVGAAFRIAEELNKKGIATYDDELKIERNFKEGQGKTQILISLKKKEKTIQYEICKNSTHEKTMKDIRALLKDYKKIKLVTLMDKVGFGFTVAKALYDEGAVTYDEELKIKRNFKEGKGKTKAFISLRKKIK